MVRFFAPVRRLLIALPVTAIAVAAFSGWAGAVSVERVVSKSGIEAWFVRDTSVPLISVEFLFRGGAGAPGIDYRGLDASAKFIELCRRKFPGIAFHHRDVFDGGEPIEPADYVVLNGVLTEKRDMTQEGMLGYMEALLGAVWPLARKGLAFNVMSTQVQWQRDDLFHVPFDTMARFVATRLSRHFLFRQDYGLYEYTTYVYRDPGS